MKLGCFDFRDGSYTAKTPRTPTSWSMPLFNDNYFTFVNQLLQGEGYHLASETYQKQLITYGDRGFWLRDRHSGKAWKLNDSQAAEDFSVTYHVNHIELTRRLDGITAKVCIFVPLQGQTEYWKITLINDTKDKRELSLFSYIGFGPKDLNMGGTCKNIGNAIIKHVFPYHVFYRDKETCDTFRQRYYLLSDTTPDSCDMSCHHFFGGYLQDGIPQAVLSDSCTNYLGEAEDFCGAMQHIVTLDADEEKCICYSLGLEVTQESILELAAHFNRELVEKAFFETKAYWENICQTNCVKTPYPAFDVFVNIWLKRQTVFLTRLNRTVQSCPIRNQLQDAMGYALLDAHEAKKFMYKVFALQRSDGYIKQWHRTDNQPGAGNVLLDHCDGPIWITLCGCILVSQLGDAEVLKEVIPYADGGEGTLLEHMMMAVRYMSKDVGAHGVCLMHDGDWTDPINGIGRDGKGESAWTSMGLLLICKWLMELCEATGYIELAEELKQLWTKTDAIVNTVLWENDRYIGGFDDQGIPFADSKDDNRVLLNVQTWALISGAARGERAKAVQNTIKAISGDLGPYTIYPGFDEWNPQWGRISLKKNGTTENGAVYCHAAMFKAFSDAVLKDGDAMFDTILRATPLNPDNPTEQNRQLPLFVPNYFYSLKGSVNYGRSSCECITGTAPWMLLNVLENVYGLKATVKGLCLEPNIPNGWDNVSCVRRYKQAVYEVTYTRSASGITVNGSAFTGDVLPYQENTVYNIVYGLADER